MAFNNLQRKRTHQCWQDMKQRCHNASNHNFANYGGRGISICQSWIASFDDFVNDMGLKPDGMTLDRIDNDGSYCPENCRWADRATQRRNQRDCVYLEHEGRTMTVEEWAREIPMHPETLRSRIRAGHAVSRCLNPEPIASHERIMKSAISGERGPQVRMSS